MNLDYFGIVVYPLLFGPTRALFLNLQISRWIPQITPPVRRFGCKSTRKSKNWMNERGNSGSVRWAEVVSNVGVSLEGVVTSESQVV